MRPSRSRRWYSAVPGNGVTIAKRGRSMPASTAKRAVCRKTSGVSWSIPNTKQPYTAMPCACSSSTTRSKCAGLLNTLLESRRLPATIDSKPIRRPRQPLRAASLKQRQIVGEQHRRQPIPLHAERHQRLEQPGGVVPVGDEVEVDENQLARAVLPDVRDDVLDRLLVRLSPPRRGHDAEIAVVDAAARRLEDVVRQEPAAGQQITPRETGGRPATARAPARSAAGDVPPRDRAAAPARYLPRSRRRCCRRAAGRRRARA